MAADHRQILYEIEKHLKKQMQFELEFQQHKATGKLVRSCSVESSSNIEQLEFTGYAEDYGGYVSEGRRRGIKGVPIRALVTWVMLKGMASDEKKARGIAFAIQRTIKEEGIPTRKSMAIAPRRTQWIDQVLTDSEGFIDDKLQELYGNEIEIEMTNIFKKHANIQ